MLNADEKLAALHVIDTMAKHADCVHVDERLCAELAGLVNDHGDEIRMTRLGKRELEQFRRDAGGR